MDRSQLVRDAQAYAHKAHEGLVRPNKARQPYHVHTDEVASLVDISGGTDEEVAAAHLHDTIEDTDTTLDDIRSRFGVTVAMIVDGLTDPDHFDGLPTLERKRVQSIRVRYEPSSVKRCKLADQTSNVRSVAVDPPVKWDRQKCLDYANGAKLIADECKGISAFLDDEFDVAYRAAIAAHQVAA